MKTSHTNRLSAEAMNDLRKIVEEEMSRSMTEDEIEEMGIRLLRFYAILTTPERGN